MSMLTIILLLSFFGGFFVYCYQIIIVQKDKKYLATFITGIVIGVCFLITGWVCYVMIIGGIKLWNMEVTGPIDKIGGGLGGTILKGSYNLVYSLFGAYTNVVCSILLIATPVIAISGIFLKKN
jgi:hypothetical protein